MSRRFTDDDIRGQVAEALAGNNGAMDGVEGYQLIPEGVPGEVGAVAILGYRAEDTQKPLV